MEPAPAFESSPSYAAAPAPAPAADEGRLGTERAIRPVAVDAIPRDIMARFRHDDGHGGAAPAAAREDAPREDASEDATHLEEAAASFASRLASDGEEDRRRASRERVSRKYAAIADAAALRSRESAAAAAGRPLDNFFDALAARSPAHPSLRPAPRRDHRAAGLTRPGPTIAAPRTAARASPWAFGGDGWSRVRSRPPVHGPCRAPLVLSGSRPVSLKRPTQVGRSAGPVNGGWPLQTCSTPPPQTPPRLPSPRRPPHSMDADHGPH